MKKLALIIIVAVTALTACEKEKPEVGGTGAEKVANEWWVQFTLDGNAVKNGFFAIATYNTASSQDSIWVDDLTHSFGFKSKAKVDLNNLTFAAANVQNTYFNPARPTSYPATTVSIINGKVLPGAGHSKAGNATDSIYVEVEFSDKPGAKYVLSGHARTGFEED
ncbi:MAG TPA: lipid-binding protein, partial [Flavisolibacter sp.]|nr:lipid-binding protein [Flavisolibacter sp.]